LSDHPRQQPEIDATRATARLSGLDIEIVHRRSPSGDAEQISINLQAVPTFEAFGRFAEPFAFWAQAMQMAWLPWRAAVQAVLPPGLTVPPMRRRELLTIVWLHRLFAVNVFLLFRRPGAKRPRGS
jgi:hypothetical protein